MVLLGLFIAYPFVRGILLSVSSARVGIPGEWVGFDNFSRLFSDPIFWLVVKNTVWYTLITTIFKLALGLWLALLLNRDFKFKAFTRAFILLPFIIPTVLSTFAWKWMFDPTFSVLNWMLYQGRRHRARAAASTGSATAISPCGRSSSSTSGAACRSSRSR